MNLRFPLRVPIFEEERIQIFCSSLRFRCQRILCIIFGVQGFVLNSQADSFMAALSIYAMQRQFSHLSAPSLNPFNVTPELTQAAISQKPEKKSLTPPPPLNPAFLIPPPTVETP